MDDERLRVLRMVQEGQITAEEAAKLLDALQASGSAGRSRPTGRNLRVRVTDPATGRVYASVNVPLALAQTFARVGGHVGALFSPQLADVDFPALLKAVEAGEPGRVVEWVEAESGRRVEVFIE